MRSLKMLLRGEVRVDSTRAVKRRAFWAIWEMDVFASTTVGRPPPSTGSK
jgi:hypothetical protein